MAEKNSSAIIWLGVLAIGGFLVYTNWASISAMVGTPAAGSSTGTSSTQSNAGGNTTGSGSGASSAGAGASNSGPAVSVTGSPVRVESGPWPAVLAAAQANAFYQSGNGLLTGSEWNAIVQQVTGTNPGAISGDPGTPISLSAYESLLSAANIDISGTTSSQGAARAGLRGFGVGILPADLVLGYGGAPRIPISAIHRGARYR